MHVAQVPAGATPTPKVPPGCRSRRWPPDLKNPRSLYVLPNGDVLVAETDGPPAPVNRPKEFVMAWIEKQAHSERQGAATASCCCATPMATACPSCRPSSSITCISPFGVALVGNDLYVANTDALALSLSGRATPRSPRPGTKLTALPGGPIDHHWTKSLTASPDGTKLYAGVGSNSNITENGIGAETGPRRDLGGRPRDRRASRCSPRGLRNPNGLQLRAADPRAVGGGQRARRARARTWCPTT